MKSRRSPENQKRRLVVLATQQGVKQPGIRIRKPRLDFPAKSAHSGPLTPACAACCQNGTVESDAPPAAKCHSGTIAAVLPKGIVCKPCISSSLRRKLTLRRCGIVLAMFLRTSNLPRLILE